MKLTNWIVITGPPSSGKTSLINALSDKGFSVYPEVAREIIEDDEQCHHYARDSLVLQRYILAITLRREHLLSVDKRVFFDRAIPDSIAYFLFHQFDPKVAIRASQLRQYAKVFYCEGLPVVRDGVRLENDKIAKTLGTYIVKAYEDQGYTLNYLPPVSMSHRLEMILDGLK